MEAPGFWDDPDSSNQKMKELKKLKDTVDTCGKLMQQYEDETERAAELDELEEYMGSSEYIEDVAKSKLGLTYENEIIFKESEGE